MGDVEWSAELERVASRLIGVFCILLAWTFIVNNVANSFVYFSFPVDHKNEGSKLVTDWRHRLQKSMKRMHNVAT